MSEKRLLNEQFTLDRLHGLQYLHIDLRAGMLMIMKEIFRSNLKWNLKFWQKSNIQHGLG